MNSNLKLKILFNVEISLLEAASRLRHQSKMVTPILGLRPSCHFQCELCSINSLIAWLFNVRIILKFDIKYFKISKIKLI